MKNITVSVGGVNVAFDEDGTMRYIAMKVVNMDEDGTMRYIAMKVVNMDEDGTTRYIAMKVVNMDELHRWQEVRCASSRRYSLGAAAMRPFAVSTAPTNLFCFTHMV